MKRVLALLTSAWPFLPAALAKAKTEHGQYGRRERLPGAIQALGNIIDDTRIETTGLVRLRRAGEGLRMGTLGSRASGAWCCSRDRCGMRKVKPSPARLSGIEDVKSVYNELTISGPTALLARSADALVTRSRLDLSPARMRGLEIKA